MRVYGSIELNWLASFYEKIFRGIPLIILIFLFAFGIPQDFLWFIDPLQRPLFSVILALGLRSGAFQSQIFRGAILSVNVGQMEAARAIGMKKLQAFQYIIFPQALRLSIPSWSNEYAVVIKDSSYAYAVGIIEITRSTYYVFVSYPELFFVSIGVLTIIYFAFTYPITRIFGERQSKKLKEFGIGGV